LEFAVTFVHAPPDVSKVPLDRLMQAASLVAMGAIGGSSGNYVHWDKLRHLDPPGDLSHEEWWAGLKMIRIAGSRIVPLADAAGRPFSYSLPDAVLRRLHVVDQRCSGEIAMEKVVTADAQARDHYIVNSLMEEAIRSSQLEGATTTRRVAKELLRTGRAPRDRSERMILNNYRALEFMRSEIGRRLTPATVLELQRILTEGTLDDDSSAGRLQTVDDERVVVQDRLDGSTLHVPPPADQLPERLEAMCAFANASDDDEQFIHPVVRGILLHFWLAYDHPFEDGNGRTARALFYWYMRTHGYWLVEYLSISSILRKAPAQYGRSFLLTETDGGDTTYFLLYQLEVIERAIEQLHRYLRRRTNDIREVEQLLRGADTFNGRQLALLGDALRHPDRVYTFAGHAAIHGVTHESARTDLSALADRRLLERRRDGRRYFFTPAADLADRLRKVR
jgi:Fic family protein